MAISTNSIIHYTRYFKILKSILSEGFKVQYCVEELALKGTKSNAAHPMVSFCDIPLSNSQQHFSAYGKFGIGLSKEWAKKNGINPVIYIDEKSLFSQCISNLIKERRDKKNTNLTKEQRTEILRIKSYAKNHSGILTRNGKKKAMFPLNVETQ
ncbi:abortive infection system antitoxin AbiGi family protein [Desulfobacter curvatus]|uniref:abortive infection system antitoxin AbiGi family protein n=1 Tax=Desulfobacter curvatus TaxID=2290 RepID=UPI0003716C9D|nr:abortive infection system antitoxin AbiGi family protein [Desulfobacter curvatus]